MVFVSSEQKVAVDFLTSKIFGIRSETDLKQTLEIPYYNNQSRTILHSFKNDRCSEIIEIDFPTSNNTAFAETPTASSGTERLKRIVTGSPTINKILSASCPAKTVGGQMDKSRTVAIMSICPKTLSKSVNDDDVLFPPSLCCTCEKSKVGMEDTCHTMRWRLRVMSADAAYLETRSERKFIMYYIICNLLDNYKISQFSKNWNRYPNLRYLDNDSNIDSPKRMCTSSTLSTCIIMVRTMAST
uniref:Uncharacterized protein n=1 Tax=Romanomermis culicivorax TaxID=13658 RepID=A0A915IRB5_ROMCU